MKLKPPSLQHIARFYKPTPEGVKKELLKLARARPPFSYENLYALVWDMVRWGTPYEQAVASAKKIAQKIKRDSYLRALAPTAKFFEGFERTYTVKIEPRAYSIGRGLRVPFAPPMLCGTEEGPVLPWLFFWQSNPISELQMSLFASMVHDLFEQESEFENARMLVVDTSIKAIDKEGMPKVLDSKNIPLLSRQEMASMLEVVAEGFRLAQQELAAVDQKRAVKEQVVADDITQQKMFE